ncbi:hypothetical protein [Thalassorhabdomicrobium marinisediminis]|uniref:hypothetical protein n=1 Tax=Thalassorhabdomicrobium marinisediminis TaxID=2170577 RepID=UPI001304A617|nr:hypothetical protein [Thalassorhabdomicrobium marinisediminis]
MSRHRARRPLRHFGKFRLRDGRGTVELRRQTRKPVLFGKDTQVVNYVNDPFLSHKILSAGSVNEVLIPSINPQFLTIHHAETTSPEMGERGAAMGLKAKRAARRNAGGP